MGEKVTTFICRGYEESWSR